MRTNCRPVGPGDGLADGGLPGSGRSDQGEDDPRAAVLGEAALGAQLAHGQVFRDAPLHVVEAFVVGVEDLPRVHGIEALLGALVPGHGQEPVQVRPDHRRLGVRLAHALEAVELALGLRAHRLRHVRGRDLLPVFVGQGAVVLAELLADGVHLLSKEVLALLLLGAVVHVVLDALAHLELRHALALEGDGELEAVDHVQGLQELALLGERQVRAVARGVGQRTRLGDGAHEGADPAVVAAHFEDFVHHRPVLALQLTREGRRGRHVRPRFEPDPEHAVFVLRRRAGDGAVQRHQRRREAAPGQPQPLGHFRHHPHLRVRLFLPGHEQDLGVRPHVHGQGHRHAREGHRVVQRDQSQPIHARKIGTIL
jgi:hypothetical protein